MDAVLLTLPLPHPQTLSHSLKMADQNLEKLKTESERLEQHTQKSVNWLLWAMLIVVCFIFISMILFIRIMHPGTCVSYITLALLARAQKSLYTTLIFNKPFKNVSKGGDAISGAHPPPRHL